MTIKQIPPKELIFNDYNSNHVDSNNMEKLKKSISTLGFNSAVIVRELENGKYEILGGQHRTMAAIELDLPTVPVISVGKIDDNTAKKITLADNSRYGVDNINELNKILKDLSEENITTILPISDEDLQVTMKAIQIDYDNLDFEGLDEAPEVAPEKPNIEKPIKTHEVLSFRLSLRNAELIRQLIQNKITEQNLDDTYSDDKTIAGDALAAILLN